MLYFFLANQDLKQNGNFNLSHYFHTYKISTCKPKKKKSALICYLKKLFVYKKC